MNSGPDFLYFTFFGPADTLTADHGNQRGKA